MSPSSKSASKVSPSSKGASTVTSSSNGASREVSWPSFGTRGASFVVSSSFSTSAAFDRDDMGEARRAARLGEPTATEPKLRVSPDDNRDDNAGDRLVGDIGEDGMKPGWSTSGTGVLLGVTLNR